MQQAHAPNRKILLLNRDIFYQEFVEFFLKLYVQPFLITLYVTELLFNETMKMLMIDLPLLFLMFLL